MSVAIVIKSDTVEDEPVVYVANDMGEALRQHAPDPVQGARFVVEFLGEAEDVRDATEPNLPELNPVEKWLEALRSGKYRQDKGRLATETGYCCLGVACEVYKETHPGWNYDPNGIRLPEVVRSWLDMQTTSGSFGDDGSLGGVNPYKGTIYLTDLNDIARYTFEQIADLIESEPKGLFV